MNNAIRVCSFNCQSLNRKSQVVQSLLSNYDILFLQETLVNEFNSEILDSLDPNFLSYYVPAVRKSNVFSGRPSGGLAAFWRKSEDWKVTMFNFSPRIMGMRIEIDTVHYLILNIYCICDYGTLDSLIEYKSIMADLFNICNDEIFDELVLVGDLNADPNKGRFYKELLDFTQTSSLFVSDVSCLPSNSYTYISPTQTCATSWLDHVLTTNISIISKHEILYGTTFYDHIPICFELHFPSKVKFDANINSNNSLYNSMTMQSRVKWDKVTRVEKEEYFETLDQIILNFYTKYDVLSCPSVSCSNESHIFALNSIYNDLFEALEVASHNLPSDKNFKKKFSVVGWNKYCKDLYANTKQKYMDWHMQGRVRFGPFFDAMRESRRLFKEKLDFCRKNEQKIRKEIIFEKFSHDRSCFWREIRKAKGNLNNQISCIDGKCNSEDIIKIFDDKYRKILDDKNCQNINFRSQFFQHDPHTNLKNITFVQVNEAISKLNEGLGWDGVHSNHFKFSGSIFRNFLSVYFNKLLSHKFVPSRMLNGQIRPTIKVSTGSKTDSNNYRPVMNSSNFLKIFEYSLLPFFERHLKLDHRQFGFRSGSGCETAVTIFKEVIENYNRKSSDVHCAFIDMTKAFDKVNCSKLVDKLKKTTLPSELVNIIDFMYSNSSANVKVCDTVGASWKIGNGTRQGGILSPLLFCFYFNSLIEKISKMPLGCSLEGRNFNILCYADDVTLLAPSASGLQKLLDAFSSEVSNLGLEVNTAKCAYMIFKKYKKPQILISKVFLNGQMIKHVTNFKFLGVILTDNFSNCLDIDRATNCFLRQFYGMYSKFYFCDDAVKKFLFKTYTSSFYGIETWYNFKNKDVYKIGVTYHKAIKKIANLNVWDSNHLGCDIVGVPIFKHLLAKRLICAFYRISLSKSPCFSMYKFYFRYKSNFNRCINEIFIKHYGVRILNNPLVALLTRINYVQEHERRSDRVGN